MKGNGAGPISGLPPGLTIREVGLRLGMDYQKCRRLVSESGYNATDGRSLSQVRKRRLDPAKVDWSRSNVAIALQAGVTREWVRKVREDLGLPKVESRGRRKKAR